MEKYIDIVLETPLFDGMTPNEALQLLKVCAASRRSYDEGEAVFLAGERPGLAGIVLEGRVIIVKEDFYGNRNIIAAAGQGQLFGEAFAFADMHELPVSVFAAKRSEILLMDCRKILTGAPSGRAALNMLKTVSNKNIILNAKIEIMSKRTTREKLLAYLSDAATKAGSGEFTIPFDRQGLADFLSVDRSAMSAELSKLRRSGIIDFKKNKFKIL